jgi:hypothetical protein
MSDSNIVGKKIVEIRPMTGKEIVGEDWTEWGDRGQPVLVLDDGTKLYPSRDDEGNGPGALFGHDGTNAFRVIIVTHPEEDE